MKEHVRVAVARPQVAVLSLGGTIAMTRRAAGGIAPSLDAADLIDAVPVLAELAHLSASAFRSTPGAHLLLDDLVALSQEIRALLASGVDGVVVTQGTDTIEETAYALDLLLETDAPVVVTGAMRGPEALSADGPANLEAAVRVASDAGARGRGVVVVLNEEIHAARWVTKTHTSRPDTFRSPGSGPLGAVTEHRVQWFWQPRASETVDAPMGALPAVPLVSTWLGDDGSLLRAALGLHPAGLVLDGLGAGHVPSALIPLLGDAARTMPVVLCSRVPCGQTFQQTYGFPGGEIDLLELGVLWSAGLPSPKARIHLTLALSAGWSRSRVAESLAAAGAGTW
ncbi:MAG: Asparaginase [Frankiales bacterium]|nr:Asparaginase [Frankiales bacterium]